MYLDTEVLSAYDRQTQSLFSWAVLPGREYFLVLPQGVRALEDWY